MGEGTVVCTCTHRHHQHSIIAYIFLLIYCLISSTFSFPSSALHCIFKFASCFVPFSSSSSCSHHNIRLAILLTSSFHLFPSFPSGYKQPRNHCHHLHRRSISASFNPSFSSCPHAPSFTLLVLLFFCLFFIFLHFISSSSYPCSPLLHCVKDANALSLYLAVSVSSRLSVSYFFPSFLRHHHTFFVLFFFHISF